MSKTTTLGGPDRERTTAKIWATLDQIKAAQARLEESQRQRAEEIRKLARRLDQDRTTVHSLNEDDESRDQKPRSWLGRLDEVPRDVDLFARWGDEELITEWEILVETLLQGGLVRLLEERGMRVLWRSGRVTVGGPGRDSRDSLDLMAEVSGGIVGVRVREPLELDHVRRFEDLMKKLPTLSASARGRPCYGAVACLEGENDAAKHAAERGMFVIRSTRKSLHMENAPDFRPRILGGPGADGDG